MSIFKPCDIRGRCPEEIDAPTAHRLGRAIGTQAGGRDILLAGDVRLSTPELKDALCAGLRAGGCSVLDAGIVPTPAVYFARPRLRCWGAVIVTASHNPPSHNGVKFMLGSRPVTPEQMEQLEDAFSRGDFLEGAGGVRPVEILGAYEAHLCRRFNASARLRVLVDAGNGAAGPVACRVLSRVGHEVTAMNCEPDGRFPNRSPNPTAPGQLAAARERVVQCNAAIGAAFDGDGDRVVFIDETGNVLPAEVAAVLLARSALRLGAGSVVYDQKCSSVLHREIEKSGGTALRERSGHAFMKRRLLDEGALVGAEISGHYFFREMGGDDALFALLRLLVIVAGSGATLSELSASVPPFYVSPDVRIPYEGDPNVVIERLAASFPDQQQDRLDGVRIQFERGWALVRPSVTEPLITCRFEGDRPADLERIKQRILPLLPAQGEASKRQ